MPKKKFSETKVGKFLTKMGSSIGEILPEKGFLGVLRQLITKDQQLTPKDKETALKLLDMDISEMEQVSKRWSSDMARLLVTRRDACIHAGSEWKKHLDGTTRRDGVRTAASDSGRERSSRFVFVRRKLACLPVV